jgi:lysozyme
MISALVKIFASLFGRTADASAPVIAAPAAPASAARLEPETPPATTVVVPAVPQPAAVAPVSKADPAPEVPKVAPIVVPGWISLCRQMTQHFERCYLIAYPDPMSALGKALQARGLWFKVLAGAAIPDEPALRALSGSPWTCGWGSTGSDVVEGTVWAQSYADWRLDAGLKVAGAVVDGAVKVPLSAAQKAALADLVYNVGAGRAAHGTDPGRDGIVVLASGKPSTLLTKLNAGDYAGCAEAILDWNRAGGAVSTGLQSRRTANRKMFLTGAWQ